MTRYFLSCFALIACLCCLPGCGSGGDAEFDATKVQAQTEAEAQEMEDYNKQLQEEATE